MRPRERCDPISPEYVFAEYSEALLEVRSARELLPMVVQCMSLMITTTNARIGQLTSQRIAHSLEHSNGSLSLNCKVGARPSYSILQP